MNITRANFKARIDHISSSQLVVIAFHLNRVDSIETTVLCPTATMTNDFINTNRVLGVPINVSNDEKFASTIEVQSIMAEENVDSVVLKLLKQGYKIERINLNLFDSVRVQRGMDSNRFQLPSTIYGIPVVTSFNVHPSTIEINLHERTNNTNEEGNSPSET